MGEGTEFTETTAKQIISAVRQVQDWQSSDRGQHSRRPRATSRSPSERMGIVVSIGSPQNKFVQVIEPVFNDTDPWDGGWVIPADPPEPVRCYPPLHAEDYQDFVLEGGPPDQPLVLMDHMNPLPVVRIRGVWFIQPQILWGAGKYPTDAEFTDCWKTGGMP